MTAPDYDTDFVAWAEAQAAALRAKDWAALDLHHLIEEVEDLAGRERREVTHELKRLLAHLLTWQVQPTHRTRSWRDAIAQAREAIDEVLEDFPSLADEPPLALPKAYRRARRQAARETDLPPATFPEACPWPLAQVLDEAFWPDDQP